MLIPHEVKSLFDFGDCAGTFPAKVCGCPPVQVIGAFLFKGAVKQKNYTTANSKDKIQAKLKDESHKRLI